MILVNECIVLSSLAGPVFSIAVCPALKRWSIVEIMISICSDLLCAYKEMGFQERVFMNNYLDQIDNDIAAKHLLKHPFYLAWARGELSREALTDYARQYYQHVATFPTY